MRRCLEIGAHGLGTTAPNPMVGCVIVHEGLIIGEGYTSPYGGAHAEINAIASVYDKSLLESATLYVSLEPCAHHGKTPPCANVIAAHKIPEVVVGIVDPYKKVAGAGIALLQTMGCKINVGVLEEECRAHHKRFLTFIEKERPYVILKWAQTEDGFIAPPKNKRTAKPEPFWISNAVSRRRVHQWRSEEQAVLVGTQTVLEDNPKLTLRQWNGKPPIRIVLDRTLKIPGNYHLLDGSVPTIIFTEIKSAKQPIENVVYADIDFSKNLANQICDHLHKMQISSVIIEGGAQTLQSFIDENYWDEVRIFIGDSIFGDGVKAPQIEQKQGTTEKIDSNNLITFYND